MENFPWTRLAGVTMPKGVKPLIPQSVIRQAPPAELRRLTVDGSFGGSSCGEPVSRRFAISLRTGGTRMAELTGKVALVTGTAHGIGTAIANGLEEDGAKVHRVDRDTADLTDAGQVAKLITRLGRIDILVNNAGGVVGQVGKPLDEVTDEEWRAIVDANLTSAFLCTRAVIPAMKAARAGWIVNISSGAGRSVSLTGIQAYASAKAGQIGFTRQMAHELGPFGITVNCIAPGFVRSNPTTEKQWESYGEEGQRRLIEGIALRRLGRPEDIANGVRFFVSARASWITGQVLNAVGALEDVWSRAKSWWGNKHVPASLIDPGGLRDQLKGFIQEAISKAAKVRWIIGSP